MVSWFGLVLAVLQHVSPALPAGATAVVSAAGENVPCFDSPASLSSFMNSYRANDRAAMALDIANNAVLLEEGTRVRSMGTQGALGGVLRLRLLSGSHAGATCYEQSVLQIYSRVRAPKRRA